MQAAKAQDDAEKRDKDRRTSPEPGSDTETETEPPASGAGTGTERMQKAERRKAPPKSIQPESASTSSPSAEAPAEPESSPGFLQPSAPGSARKASDEPDQQRRRSLADSDYVSTDSEWEKVSGDEARK